MIVWSGDYDGEAQERNCQTTMEMYHVLVISINIFDAQQTWIDARKIAYSSNLVKAESDKVLNISNALLNLRQQKHKFLTHFISGHLYKDSICDNM